MFYFLIGALNLRNLDHEDGTKDEAAMNLDDDTYLSATAAAILADLGGTENIAEPNHRATRLRVTVEDSVKVGESTTKRACVGNVVRSSQTVLQVVMPLGAVRGR